MVRPNGSVIGRASDGLDEAPVIQCALSLRQPPSGDGAQFRSDNLSIMQSADNPHLVWCSAISGSAGALAPDRGTAIRREPRPCPWGLSASSASAASWWAWWPWGAGRPAAVPPPPDWD